MQVAFGSAKVSWSKRYIIVLLFLTPEKALFWLMTICIVFLHKNIHFWLSSFPTPVLGHGFLRDSKLLIN